MSSQSSPPALTPNAYFHHLIENELNGTGKNSDLAEIIFTVLKEPFLQKNNRTATGILKLYRNASKVKAKNEIAVALLACLTARKTITEQDYSFGESYLGTKTIKSATLLNEMAHDHELNLDHRAEALAVIAANTNENKKRFFGLEKSDCELMSFYSDIVYNEKNKQLATQKITELQQKTLDALEPGILKILTSDKFDAKQNNFSVYKTLINVVKFACEKPVRDKAVCLLYQYTEQVVAPLAKKKSNFNNLNEIVQNDADYSAEEKQFLQNRVELLQTEIALDDQNHSFEYETTGYNNRDSYTIGDYQERIDAKQAVLDKLKSATNNFFAKRTEFQQQPVLTLFQP